MNLEDSQKENFLNYMAQKTVNLYDNSLTLFSMMLFVIGLYLIVFILRVPTGDNKPMSLVLIESVAWFLLATLAIHNVLKYMFNLDLLDYLRDDEYKKYLANVMDENVETDGSGNVITEEKEETPEVFNVSNNLYTFEDAQAVCKALDARLATYEEIESAYNNGAEWCNYGWSADQLALFPTQLESWKERQGDCKSKNRCGRPGINGGYFKNPYIKFGANCYGVKPKASDEDTAWMNATGGGSSAPLTASEQRLEDKVEYWKENVDQLQLNSFNKENWSRY